MDSKFVLGFILGTAAGSVVTYFAVKDKEKKRADEEIAEAREAFRQMRKEDKAKAEADEPVKHFRKVGPLSEQNELKEKIKEQGYNYSDISKADEGKAAKEHGMTITEIDSNEYDMDNDHDKQGLTWYVAQHILTDEDDNRLSDEEIESTVGGYDNLKDFGRDDVKYIRNEDRNTDYEIVIDDVNTWTDPNDSGEVYHEER